MLRPILSFTMVLCWPTVSLTHTLIRTSLVTRQLLMCLTNCLLSYNMQAHYGHKFRTMLTIEFSPRQL
jgi:hypothetical protein